MSASTGTTSSASVYTTPAFWRCGIGDSTGGGGRERGTDNHAARGSAAEHSADDSRNSGHSALGGAHRCVPIGDEPRSEWQTAHRDREGSARRDRGCLGTQSTIPQAGRDPVARRN
jgi:hypothetical protein